MINILRRLLGFGVPVARWDALLECWVCSRPSDFRARTRAEWLRNTWPPVLVGYGDTEGEALADWGAKHRFTL